MIAFIGDSNTVLAATAVLSVEKRSLAVFSTRLGAGVDGWESALEELHASCRPDSYVVNLGLNDALDCDGWAERAEMFRRLLPGPVVWSNLPTEIEPLPRRAGCEVINAALKTLNVSVVDWASVANRHPEWIERGHLNEAGATAWVECVLARKNAPTRR